MRRGKNNTAFGPTGRGDKTAKVSIGQQGALSEFHQSWMKYVQSQQPRYTPSTAPASRTGMIGAILARREKAND